MDDFKGISEEERESSGNVIPMNVANSLKQACRKGGLIARFGDEFLVFLKNITDITAKVSQALLQQLPGKRNHKPYEVRAEARGI